MVIKVASLMSHKQADKAEVRSEHEAESKQ